MSFFKRLFNIGSSEAHAALDKLEDPIKMTEQGIRNLKSDLAKSMQNLAEVKAVYIRSQHEYSQNKEQAKSYENKAILLLNKVNSGGLAVVEGERLAEEALQKKSQHLESAATSKRLIDTQKDAVAKLEANINKLRSQISKWENEAKVLKARSRVSAASAKINKQLANVDSSSTVSMLERMREKVDQQEALAESYGGMADDNQSIDAEIDSALSEGSGSTSLEALKRKLALESGKTST